MRSPSSFATAFKTRHLLAIQTASLLLIAGCGGIVGSPADSSASAGAANARDSRTIAADNLGAGPLSVGRLESGQLSLKPGPIILAGSRNETLGFAVVLSNAKLDRRCTLRLAPLTALADPNTSIPLAAFELGQIMNLPVDLNRAGYIRQSGSSDARVESLPRAILPIAAPTASIALEKLRNDDGDTQNTSVWVDLALPTQTPAGDYRGAVELLDPTGKNVLARMPIRLAVYDLVLPDQRSLNVLGDVRWSALERHFTDSFEAITPRLMNRTDARYLKPIAILDSLMTLAQKHRLTLAIDRLQPTAKWNPTTVDWRDYDSVVSPWLDGTGFADKEPLGLSALPRIDYLANYPAAAQRSYYANAGSHLDSRDWLRRMPVWIDAPQTDSGPQIRRTLEQAADVLGSHPRVIAAVPIEADRLLYADSGQSDLPRRSDDERLMTASPGLIYNTPITTGPPRRSPTFLRTDLAGLLPYAGTGGDERDVRVWAWLAYTRNTTSVRFDSVLPRNDRVDQVADPSELVWFFPGKWFGVEGVVPSLQLKWLRRAEQDHEYLMLADARGQRLNALLMARLLTRPVQILPSQSADALYTLMAGTADQTVWDTGMQLLAKTILIRPPGAEIDQQAQTALNIETLQWTEPQEKPIVVGRSTIFQPLPEGKVDVRIGIDLYNASDMTSSDNKLGFNRVPRGWTVEPEPTLIPPLAAYKAQRFALQATVDPGQTNPREKALLSVDFTNGYTRRSTPAPIVVPSALSRRREGNLTINGSLEDWTDDDALNLAPLTKMLDRVTLQQHTLADAKTTASVYSGWSEANAYFAFKVSGLSTKPLPSAQNFVRYDFRRAWGEDVVQLLVQAIYADGTLGPVLHIACKPNGGQWSERKLDLREGSDAWEPLESGARYACTVDAGDWRGEVAIPWRAIHPINYADGPGKLPVMLRFNFVQHQQDSGTSASWAGPIDHGRDDSMMGVLMLRNAETK